jgi:hypothetical protein
MDPQQVSLDRTLPIGGVITTQAQVNPDHVWASLATNVPFSVEISELRNDFIVAIA